jgi:invasion protein IalB
MTIRRFAVLLFVFAAILTGGPGDMNARDEGISFIAGAQAQTAPQRPSPPASVPLTSQSRRPEKGKLYGDWGIECETQADRSELCFIQQTHTQKESNQRILSIVVGYIGPRGAPMMIAYTPLGIDLSAGAAVKVEPGPQINMRIQTCVPDGCRVAADLTEPQLAALRAAKSMAIGMIPWGQTQTTNVVISVNGFAAALAALK